MHADRHQPRASALRIDSRRPAAPGGCRRLLHGVLGMAGITEDREGKRKEMASLGREHIFELGVI